MGEFQWWKSLSIHMWRAYFAFRADPGLINTPAKKRKYDACHAAYIRFPERERDILQTYFTAKWGDRIYVAEEYAASSGIPINSIYHVINRAERLAVELVGLLDAERR